MQLSDFKKWFPHQSLAKHPSEHGYKPPSARIVAFHSAGSDASIFTSTFMDRKPVRNSFTRLCGELNIHLYCPLLPGRSYRAGDPLSTTDTIPSLTSQIYEVLKNVVCGSDLVPYFLVGHSMGAYFGLEFIQVALSDSRPLPLECFFSCAISPQSPIEMRPWTPVSKFPMRHKDLEFQNEMRKFGIREKAFEKMIWETVGVMVFNDMELIDKYHPCEVKLNLPNTKFAFFWAENDETITKSLIETWMDVFVETHEIEFCLIPKSNHSIFYNEESRELWSDIIIRKMTQTLKHDQSFIMSCEEASPPLEDDETPSCF